MFSFSGCFVEHGIDGRDGTNGTNGVNASIQTSAEPAGENCPNGGIKIEVLQDGVIQEAQTQFICNGGNGQQGTNGTNASIQTTAEPPGENCPNGGTRVDVLIDGNVQDDKTQYICHGEDGRDGCHAWEYKNRKGECAPVPPGFVLIPAGSFVLTHDTELYSAGDKVVLDSFVLGKTPVTVEQFEKCVAAGACSEEHFQPFSEEWIQVSPGVHRVRDGCSYGRSEAFANHPMDCVDWYGANEYCQWIGGRLPTEEEWEYAATHDGSRNLGTKYPWGDDEPVHCVTANYRIEDTYWYCDGTTELQYDYSEYAENYKDILPAAVGTYSPAGDSPLGLVDMSGNVWEMTSTRSLGPNPYETESTIVLKGGSGWIYEFCLALEFRTLMPETLWQPFMGFRCAK